MIRIAANPSPFEQAEAYLMETMFYDQWAPSGENVVAKPRGTFVPRWEDVQDDPEPDLRELLAQKKKRKEAPAAEPDKVPQCIRVRGLDGKIVYEGAWGPRVRSKWVPPKKGNTRVWHVALLKEVWEKKKKRMRQLRQKGTSRLWQKKD